MTTTCANPRASMAEITPDGGCTLLPRAPLSAAESGYNEAFIENLLFQNPQLLPVAEIDAIYSNPVPACTQLQTGAGPLDALFITPNGRLVIVEAKLWRNPEARRKVIAQLLDYAAELARWDYEQLERAILRRPEAQAESLYQLICGDNGALDEARFIDEVSRSLRLGRFLLLVCGDGIREGLAGITGFLEQHTTLDFTFALVELAIFEAGQGRRLVQPRVLARSETLHRFVVQTDQGQPVLKDIGQRSITKPPSERQLLLNQFWEQLAQQLWFDDPQQLPPTPVTGGHTKLCLPSSQAWVTLYFDRDSAEQGLFLAVKHGEPGDTFWHRLQQEQEQINSQLPDAVRWYSKADQHRISLSQSMPGLHTDNGYNAALHWFCEWAPVFVRVFRGRIGHYLEEI